jgi:alpha-N-arabinofuranosidase
LTRIRTIALTLAGLIAVSAHPSSATASGQSIYADSLTNGWQPWGWATINYNCANPVHAGHKSIAVTIKKGWDALYIHHSAFNTTVYTSFTFWVNGGAKGGQVLQIQATANKKPIKYFKIAALRANAWTQVTIPLTALGAAHRKDVDGFWIEDGTGKPLPTFFVDDIALK